MFCRGFVKTMVDINPIILKETAIFVESNDGRAAHRAGEALSFWINIRAVRTLDADEKKSRGLVRLFPSLQFEEEGPEADDDLSPIEIYVPSTFATEEFAKMIGEGPKVDSGERYGDFNAYFEKTYKDDEKIQQALRTIRANPRFVIMRGIIDKVKGVCERLEERKTGNSTGKYFTQSWIVGQGNLRENIRRVAEYMGVFKGNRRTIIGLGVSNIGDYGIAKKSINDAPHVSKTEPIKDLSAEAQPIFEKLLNSPDIKAMATSANSHEFVNIQRFIYDILVSNNGGGTIPSFEFFNKKHNGELVYDRNSNQIINYDKFEDFMHIARSCFAELYNMKMRNPLGTKNIVGYAGKSSPALAAADLLVDVLYIAGIYFTISATMEYQFVTGVISTGMLENLRSVLKTVNPPVKHRKDAKGNELLFSTEEQIRDNKKHRFYLHYFDLFSEWTEANIPTYIKEIITETSDTENIAIAVNVVLTTASFAATSIAVENPLWILPILFAHYLRLRIEVRLTTIVVRSLSDFIFRLLPDTVRGGWKEAFARIACETAMQICISLGLSSPYSLTEQSKQLTTGEMTTPLPTRETFIYRKIMDMFNAPENVRTPFVPGQRTDYFGSLLQLITGTSVTIERPVFAAAFALVLSHYMGQDLFTVIALAGIGTTFYGLKEDYVFPVAKMTEFVNRMSNITIGDYIITSDPDDWTKQIIANANISIALPAPGLNEGIIPLRAITSEANGLLKAITDKTEIIKVVQKLGMDKETGEKMFAWAFLADLPKDQYKAIRDSNVKMLPSFVTGEFLENLAKNFSRFVASMDTLMNGKLTHLASVDYKFLSYLSLKWVANERITTNIPEDAKKAAIEQLSKMTEIAINGRIRVETALTTMRGIFGDLFNIVWDAAITFVITFGLQSKSGDLISLSYLGTYSAEGIARTALISWIGAAVIYAAIKGMFNPIKYLVGQLRDGIMSLGGGIATAVKSIFNFMFGFYLKKDEADRTTAVNEGPNSKRSADEESEKGAKKIKITDELEEILKGYTVTLTPDQTAGILVLGASSKYVTYKLSIIRQILDADLSSHPDWQALIDWNERVDFEPTHPCHIPLDQHLFRSSGSGSETQVESQTQPSEDISQYYRVFMPEEEEEDLSPSEIQTRMNNDVKIRELFPHLVDMAIISVVLNN